MTMAVAMKRYGRIKLQPRTKLQVLASRDLSMGTSQNWAKAPILFNAPSRHTSEFDFQVTVHRDRFL